MLACIHLDLTSLSLVHLLIAAHLNACTCISPRYAIEINRDLHVAIMLQGMSHVDVYTPSKHDVCAQHKVSASCLLVPDAMVLATEVS